MGIFNLFRRNNEIEDITNQLIESYKSISIELLKYSLEYGSNDESTCYKLIKANSSASALVLAAYLARNYSPRDTRKSTIEKSGSIAGGILPKVTEVTLTYIYKNNLDDNSLQGLKGYNFMMNMSENKSGNYYQIIYDMSQGDPEYFGIDLCMSISNDLTGKSLFTKKLHTDIVETIVSIKKYQ
jgi:hypothetical protein